MSDPTAGRGGRPPLPYDPHREFREETRVLVFHDVPEADWVSRPSRMIDCLAGWVAGDEDRSARSLELHRMPYPDYLQTDEWKTLRKIVIRRAQMRCEWCGRRDQKWNVHHLTYERRGYERLEDLALLCETCHHNYHHPETMG